MGKDDFRDKIEEHRQTIENEGESKPSRMSRANHNTNGEKKKTKNKNKNPLMRILLVVFIFIPLSILVYVWGFYEPQPEKKEIVKSEQDVVEVVKNNNAIISKPEATEAEDDQKLAKEEAAKEEAAEKIAQEQAAKDAAMLEEQEAQAKQKAEEEKKKQEANKKTHTVQANETLYRIALNYYGNGDAKGIEKIKQANGMSSETISVGQTLIIPE